MNIKFGMDNFYVRYLKRFLNNEMNKSSTILGNFDKSDLQRLISYLNLPNVKDMFTVQKETELAFPGLKTMFNIKLHDDMIVWTSKVISQEVSQYLMSHTDELRSHCNNSGWEVSSIIEWVDSTKDINSDGVINNLDREILYNIIYKGTIYPPEIMAKADLNLDGVIDDKDLDILDKYLVEGKLSLTIKQTARKNYFPNKDMLVFINQFDGTFLYNYAIRADDSGMDDTPHPNNSGNYKIALYQCTPGQKITIAHSSASAVRLVIGSCPAKLKQNIPGTNLTNVVDIKLSAGDSYQYTCSSKAEGSYDAHWVCIQCPSNYGNLSGTTTKSEELEVGDINFDGKIDLQDYHLLARYTATGPGSEELKWEPTARQLAVMDINGDKKINNKDTIYLKRFIDNEPGMPPSLGVVNYTYIAPGEYEEGNNVKNLLIIDGHYDRSVNIPFRDFMEDDWVVHNKFFNYLLGMAIHKYSTSEDISYLQKLLKEYYPEHSYDQSYFYPGFYNDNMKTIMTDYQKSKTYYTQGDLNRDGKLDNTDLSLLRKYIDDVKKSDVNLDGYTNEKDLEMVYNYIQDPIKHPLTPEQFEVADMNKDGVVDSTDYELLKKFYAANIEPLSSIFISRADVNRDGYVNELDYQELYYNIEGTSQSLKNYEISFILGWCDVQTENLLEDQVNISGNISEVSK